MTLKGGCLCGAVRYEANGPIMFSGHCFCTDCQKASGCGHITVVAVESAQFTLHGTVSQYAKAGESGASVVRSFCATCGTPIFSEPKVVAGATLIRTGTLDDPSAITPQMSIFTRSALLWDPPAANIPAIPGAPQPPA